MLKPLFIITARGGSKGIPGKNIKPLNGKPLIHYSIEFARKFASDEDICLSTDSDDIINCVAQVGYTCPFVRPAALAADNSGSFEVLQHALEFYESKKRMHDVIVLLQPTSPFRLEKHLNEAIASFDNNLDMIVSVQKSKANPYYNLFEEGSDGYLKPSKISDAHYFRRQDAPPVYQHNGSIYIINPASLRNGKSFRDFQFVRKYVMDDVYSHDLDTIEDWMYAEFLIEKKFISL